VITTEAFSRLYYSSTPKKSGSQILLFNNLHPIEHANFFEKIESPSQKSQNIVAGLAFSNKKIVLVLTKNTLSVIEKK
jgi:hypothetical protein